MTSSNPNGVEQMIYKLFRDARGKERWSFLIMFIPLFAFFICAFMCSTKLSLTSSSKPRCLRTFSLFIIILLREMLP